MAENVIYSINGPVVKVKDTTAFSMLERVLVGKKKLMGEVISISRSFTTIQVYESTTGLMPGEEVIPTGSPVSVTLAPGILRNIFDGIERPLQAIAERSGAFIATGSDVASLDEEKQWDVRITVKAGDHVRPGQVYATVIPRNVRLSEAPSHGKPVLDYDPYSRGAEAYRTLAEEIAAKHAASN